MNRILFFNLLTFSLAVMVTQVITQGTKASQKEDTYLSSVSLNQDQKTRHKLQESINRATELISNYQRQGLVNMPNLPRIPGLGALMRVPDKILRAELSMLQDEIKMAQTMLNNPMGATMSAPRDIATMISRIAEQLEQ